MLPSARDGHSRAPDTGAVWRSRGRRGAQAFGADAFLPARRGRRHPWHRRRSLSGPRHTRRGRVVLRRRGRVMLVVMENHATPEQIERVVKTIEEMGYAARPMPGETRTTVGLVGNDGRVDGSRVEALPGVAEIIHVSKPYKQVSREWRSENTIVTIAPGVSFGGTGIVVIAGPCSVESEEQILASARAVRDAGATALRGGAFKPRSSPYSFQGLGK